MQIVLQGKSKRDNDRFRRYQDLLKGCKTASECLIKACLDFDLRGTQSSPNDPAGDLMDVDDEGGESSHTAVVTSGSSQSLITVREKEMETLIVDLEHNLLRAAWLEQQCGRATKDDHKGSHFLRWKSEIERDGLKDPTATSKLRYYLTAALRNVDANTEDLFYRDPPTAKDLKNEKKAMDELKKREKAKRIADRKNKDGNESAQKQKAPKKSRAIASLDEDSAGSAASDNEPIQADDKHPHPSGPKPEKIRKDDFETYASELRGFTAHLRGLAVELTSRTRSLRFARGARKLQQWHGDQSEPPRCKSCKEFIYDPDKISINIRCGHLTCGECIQQKGIQQNGLAVCAVNGCGEGAESFRLRMAVDLVGDGNTWEHGSRLGNIIALINSLPEDEQILLFVQFEDVMLNMAEGLEEANISNYALTKSAGRRMVEMMNDFQDNDGEERKRVLLLNPSSETAAGM